MTQPEKHADEEPLFMMNSLTFFNGRTIDNTDISLSTNLLVYKDSFLDSYFEKKDEKVIWVKVRHQLQLETIWQELK